MENFIDLQAQLNILPGIDSARINEMKEKYGLEHIEFWHFRHFAEMCDYILENDINNENFLSKDAKDRLVNYFSDFSEKHPL